MGNGDVNAFLAFLRALVGAFGGKGAPAPAPEPVEPPEPSKPAATGIITAGRLSALSSKCDAATLAPLLQAAADEFEINTPKRVSNWLGQLHHESVGFTRLEENLNYSPARLVAVWPRRFPDIAAATPYAHNPQALANKAYGLRFGNRLPGDGWKYRGRGFTGLTFHDNYAEYGEMIGVDLENNPDLSSTPPVAARIAAAYWWHRGLNELADKGDVVGITGAIQGGTLGLSERAALVRRAESIFV